ncbi:hypothetical protein M9Y10_026238 [Tritrichomonas musculus]|uniref:Uncharacterized protein n=1 Tax=Tritrichomonas musculus TaxID=1915356 RepID=A0ABR2GMF7_9EUKA
MKFVKIVIKTKETTKQEENNNNNNNNNNIQDILPAYGFSRFLLPSISTWQIINPDDFKFFEYEKIPKEMTAQFTLSSLDIKQIVISLRYSILNVYNSFIESW